MTATLSTTPGAGPLCEVLINGEQEGIYMFKLPEDNVYFERLKAAATRSFKSSTGNLTVTELEGVGRVVGWASNTGALLFQSTCSKERLAEILLRDPNIS